MPKPTFLQILKDHDDDNIWCISPIAMPNPGHAFLIVCSSEREAKQVVENIGNNLLNYPTVDSSGFRDITNHFPHLKNLVKVFQPA